MARTTPENATRRSWRAGQHHRFLHAMVQRLSRSERPARLGTTMQLMASAKTAGGIGKELQYHRRSLVEILIYLLKVLTGGNVAVRAIGAQATGGAIRAGVLNRLTLLTCPQSIRTA